MNLLPPRFGPYVIERELGRGSFGVVFLVHREGAEERYALKVHTGPRDRETLIRLQLEAEVAGKIDHPGVVKVRDHGVIDGRDYLLLDYCEGQSLHDLLRRGALPWERAVQLVLGVAHTVAAAHAQGILHRDLKPANVIVEAKSGVPKLIDFGLARDHSLVRSLTQSQVVLGTPLTMSPEQLRGSKRIDARSDVYSLGVILYWCLSGEPPFKAANVIELERRVHEQAPAPLRERAPDVPTGVERVCLQALAKERDARPADAGALAALLEAALFERCERAPRPRTRPARARRRPLALAGVGLGFAISLPVALVWLAQPSASSGTASPSPATRPSPTRPPADPQACEALMSKCIQRARAFAPLDELRGLLDRAEVAARGDPQLEARVRLERAEILRRRGDYEGAIATAPVDAHGELGFQARFCLAVSLLRAGYRERADEELFALARDDPSGANGLDAKTVLQLGGKLPGPWAETGWRCYLADPSNLHARIMGAYASSEREGVSVALERLNEIERDEPDETHVSFVRSFVLSNSGDLRGAREAFYEVLRRIAPYTSEQALFGVAIDSLQLDDLPAALEATERLTREAPHSVRGHVLRGYCLYADGRRELAVEAWREACRRRNPETWEDVLRVLPPDFRAAIRDLAREIPAPG